MTHIAILENLNGKAVDWMEKVIDEQYRALLRREWKETSSNHEHSGLPKKFSQWDSAMPPDVRKRSALPSIGTMNWGLRPKTWA
jgi:hypothetical protein